MSAAAGSRRAGGSPPTSPPRRPVRHLQDNRHAFMQLLHGRVGSGGQDGEGPHSLFVWRAPAFSDSGEGKRRPVPFGDSIGLLAVRHSLLLIKCVRRHQAASRGERTAEHAGRSRRLRPCVDRLAGSLQVLGEVRHQAPSQQIKPALARIGMPANDHRVLRRRHVPRRRNIGQLPLGAATAAAQVGRPGPLSAGA
jgi:hypothetical protein